MSGIEGHPTAGGGDTSAPAVEKKKDKARVSRTSLILWHAHQNDAAAVRKLLEEDRSLVHAMDYDNRTPLHVASLHGWMDVAKCLIEYGADVNAQDRWKNTVCYTYIHTSCVCLIISDLQPLNCHALTFEFYLAIFLFFLFQFKCNSL